MFKAERSPRAIAIIAVNNGEAATMTPTAVAVVNTSAIFSSK